MAPHERRFRPEQAHKLDDPERRTWLPVVEVISALGVRPGMQIADVGAGTGYFSIPFARAVQPNGHVYAVDVQDEMLALLRARLDPALPVSALRGDAEHTPLAAGQCDVVFYGNVWHEIDDRTAALAEAARILRANGTIAILDWRADVEPPPGPPRDHRLAVTDIAAELRTHGWQPTAPIRIGPYTAMLVASRAT